MPIDSHVATVTAKDLDCQKSPESDDCRVSYSIRGGDGLGSFYIDDGGNIKTAAVLVRFLSELSNMLSCTLPFGQSIETQTIKTMDLVYLENF